ncbi:MAG: class I SAM-dependent methyltransferase [Methylococcales bacterium]
MHLTETNHRSLMISELPDTCVGEICLRIPAKFRRGVYRADERKSIESAIHNLKVIADLTRVKDWSTKTILDFGCGVKFTQALVQYNVGVGTYVGMDVHEGLINCLNERVNRPNFCFYPVPFQNDMYNPKGIRLQANSKLPGLFEYYDLITLQSVFTHFEPADFQALLHVLRPYAASESRMLFSCAVDNDMDGDFLDSVPGQRLMKAFYKESFIRSMLKEANWIPLSFHPPNKYMRYHFVCKPGS